MPKKLLFVVIVFCLDLFLHTIYKVLIASVVVVGAVVTKVGFIAEV